MEGTPTTGRSPLAVFVRFLGLGFQAWGDSTARLAVLYKELVEKEAWIGNLAFARAYGVYNALPGPEALEMAVYLGYRRGGRLGGFLAGLGFTLPGFALTVILAVIYSTFGADAWGLHGILYVMKPVVIALVAHALIRIARASLTNDILIHLALAAFLASLLLPVSLVVVLFVLAGGYYLARNPPRAAGLPGAALTPFLLGPLKLPLFILVPVFFLEAGFLTFGGSYTVLPFIERGAVEEFGWFSRETFLDAVALCALVPAPMVIVGAFLGYLVDGLLGAVLATAAVLFPAFAFTLIAPKALIRLAESPRARDFFDGVIASVVGLVTATLLRLGQGAIVDVPTWLILVASFTVLLLRRASALVVVLGAALVGLALAALRLLP